MPQSVAEMIRCWSNNRAEGGPCLASPELLTWAESFEDDLEQAWSSCPRGDHGVVLASACAAPAEPLAVVALEAAERAQRLVPERVDLGRRAVALARRILEGSVSVTDAAPALLAVEAPLGKYLERRGREVVSQRTAHEKLFRRACVDLATRMTLELGRSNLGTSAASAGGPLVRPFMCDLTPVEIRFAKTKLAAAFEGSDRRLARSYAELRALEAAAAALVVACCCSLAPVLEQAIQRAAAIGSDAADDFMDAVERLDYAREALVTRATVALSCATEAARTAEAATPEGTAASVMMLREIAFFSAIGREADVTAAG
jgi:hypothetical protein